MRRNILVGAIFAALAASGTLQAEAGTTHLLLSPPGPFLTSGPGPIQIKACSGSGSCPATIYITKYDPAGELCYGYIDYGIIIARQGFFGGYPLLIWQLDSSAEPTGIYTFNPTGIEIVGAGSGDFGSGGYSGGVHSSFEWQVVAQRSLGFPYNIHLLRVDASTHAQTACDLVDPVIINRGD